MSDISKTSSDQYLTFHLNEEKFSLDISQVKEVLDFTAITKVPRTPDFMRGIINLRGSVVPVIDLKIKMGMPKSDRTVHTRIIIVEVSIDGEATVIGIIADSVEEVCEIEPEMISPPPKLGTRLKTEFIQGMGKLGDEFVIILDIDKVFSADELFISKDSDDPEREAGMTADHEKA